MNSLDIWNPRFLVTLFCLVVSSSPVALLRHRYDSKTAGMIKHTLHWAWGDPSLNPNSVFNLQGGLGQVMSSLWILVSSSRILRFILLALPTSLGCWEDQRRRRVWKRFEMVMSFQRPYGGLPIRNVLSFRSVGITGLLYPRYTLGLLLCLLRCRKGWFWCMKHRGQQILQASQAGLTVMGWIALLQNSCLPRTWEWDLIWK